MISVITPVHGTAAKYLPEAWESLKQQTVQDFEWIIVPNRGATIPNEIQGDQRVRIFSTTEDDGPYNKIGRLKKEASQHARGDVIVEFDSDDILDPLCLSRVMDAFNEHPEVMVVYSNAAEFQVMALDQSMLPQGDDLYTTGTDDQMWRSGHYSSHFGWQFQEKEFRGHRVWELLAWPPSSHMMRYIYWCPNHVRAWRASAYWTIGGHDPSFGNADDHDLMCRFYIQFGAKGFHHINECLYYYRVHDTNSCRVWNQEIQDKTDWNYLRFVRAMAERDARDQGLRLIDLGGRIDPAPGYETVDFEEPCHIKADLNSKWPFENSSVGVIRASNVLEHLVDPIHAMNEIFRVLAPGGWAFISVPSTDGRGAFQDPTHVSYWNSNSFWYYTREDKARFIRPAFKGRFQLSRIVNWKPDDFSKMHDIVYTEADLICLKPPYSDRPSGEVLI
jgi:glycosyltransferase involved in cell wall biosynthesis